MCSPLIEKLIGDVPLRKRVIACASSRDVRAFLVGGTVRDALLGRRSYDLDIAVDGSAMDLARHVADTIHGAYVPMDVERDVARVVVRVGSTQQHFDFAGLRAGNIEADLWARDFTINAMAVRLQGDVGQLLDPTGGQADLHAGVLRAVYEDTFRDDPLRILRGVRLRGVLRFEVASATEVLARASLPALRQVSTERIRDEMVQILALPDASESLTYAGRLGALGIVLPELGQDDVQLARAAKIMAAWERCFGPQASDDAPAEQVYDRVRRVLLHYRPALQTHWSKELSTGRARWIASKLAALLSVIPKAPLSASGVAKRLCFSGSEARHVAATIRGATWNPVWTGSGKLDLLTIHRYYRAWGPAGVDGATLRVATCLAESRVGEDVPQSFLARLERLLGAWFEERTWLVYPPPLLTGHDAMQILGMDPGPAVGQVLQHLREAQVQGLVSTREEAITYLRLRGKASDRGSDWD